MRPEYDSSPWFRPYRAPDSPVDPEAPTQRASNVPMQLSPTRTLDELEAFLRARLLRLEITLGADGAEIVADGLSLRALLAEASEHARSATEPPSCERDLAETLRGVYAWVYGALDAVFLGEYVRPLPKRLINDLTDHGSVASMRSLLDPARASLEPTLRRVVRACIRLSRSRG
jgi:hypothetical protein